MYFDAKEFMRFTLRISYMYSKKKNNEGEDFACSVSVFYRTVREQEIQFPGSSSALIIEYFFQFDAYCYA